MKKFLSVIMAIILILSTSIFNASAFFEDVFYEDGPIIYEHVYYALDSESKTAAVFGYDTDDDGQSLVAESLTIPKQVQNNGKKYTVTEIAYGAFMDCSSIKSVNIPDTVTTIDNYAFGSAQLLEKVNIPSSIEFEYFGVGVFDNTFAMNYFAENSVDGEIILGQNVLLAYLGNAETYTVSEEIDFIADRCFFMSGVKNINLNNNIEEIYEYTFANCRNLKEITIPDSVYYIGDGAFANCTNLEKVNLGDYIEIIGIRAFEGTIINEIYIGDSMYDLMGAFAGCNTIEKFNISDNNENYYVDNDALCFHSKIVDEDGSIWFEDYYLEYYIASSDNKTYTVPGIISFIGDYAFYNCDQLENVTFTSPVAIGNYAFADCSFESFDFSKVTDTGYGAFRSCKSIKVADLSNTYSIGDSAFENCTSLSSVTFYDELSVIGSRAFANTAIETANISGDLCDIYDGAFSECLSLKTVNFDDGVYYIGNEIFANCPSLETVYISETVEYIEANAFIDCENVNFEVIKYSYGYDFISDLADEMDISYEVVGSVSFIKRLTNFFNQIFAFLFGWLMF